MWTIVAINGTALLAGVVLAFLTRDVVTLFNESKVNDCYRFLC